MSSLNLQCHLASQERIHLADEESEAQKGEHMKSKHWAGSGNFAFQPAVGGCSRRQYLCVLGDKVKINSASSCYLHVPQCKASLTVQHRLGREFRISDLEFSSM